MANINSVSNSYSSSSSSLYGNKNVISGLASGMDTESMIQNSIVGYQTKITQLQQSQTKLEWKQDAFRDIISQMYGITQKYTSYTSKTNLSSNGFFTGATTTTAQGENASAIIASGRATSNIRIDSVTQLASAARYSVSADGMKFNNAVDLTGGAISGEGTKKVSAVEGSLTLTLGNDRFTLDFGEDDVYENAQELLKGINDKLKEQDADVKATLEDGKITFQSTSSKGDSVYLSGASGKFRTELGVEYASSRAATNRFSYTSIDVGGKTLNKELSMAEYLSDKTVDVTLDGVTKKISVGTLDASSEKPLAEQIRENLQTNLNKAFGNGAVSVNTTGGALSFGVREGSGSTLLVKADTEELGLDKGLSNYFNTSRSLDSLLGDDYFKVKGNGTPTISMGAIYHDEDGNRVDKDGYLLDERGNYAYEEQELIINGVSIGKFGKDAALDEVMNAINNNAEAGVNVSFSRLTGEFVFNAKNTGANQTIEFGEGLGKRLFDNTSPRKDQTLGELLDSDWFNDDGSVALKLGGDEIDLTGLTRESTLTDLKNRIDEAGAAVGVQYDAESDTFAPWTTDPLYGDVGEVQISANGKSMSIVDLFKGKEYTSFTAGTDAEVHATVNGKELTLRRATNVLDMDGMTVTLKDTFTEGEAVTFKTESDADKIVDAIKGFVTDINKLMNDIHSAYTTQPAEKNSRHERYQPLTEDDKKDMSESAIKAYEEKAKQGLLFGDTDLRQLYERLRSVIQPGGKAMGDLKDIGIKAEYSNGVATLELEEDKLRAVLDSNPDKVRTVFATTQDGENGLSGMMEKLKSPLNAYGSTSMASPGILVRKAGSKLSSNSLISNNLQQQINNVNKQIESWQTKLSNKVDFYTRQFTTLEKMIASMNNQSSMLAELQGGA